MYSNRAGIPEREAFAESTIQCVKYPELIVAKSKKNETKIIDETNTAASKSITARSSFLFYFIMISIPIMFFVCLEFGLRIVNYGYDYTQWIEASETKLVLNPEISAKYFSTREFIPTSNYDTFDKIKKPNSFRIFVLGESSAAGFPYSPNGSFSRYLKDKLEFVYPDKTIEVVNLGMSAINSFTINDLMPGVIEQKPDAIIIYAGHNEYYGALGIGSTHSIGGSKTLVEFYLWLKHFRTTQLIQNIISNIAGLFASGNGSEEARNTLMSKMAGDQFIEYKGEKYNSGIDQFKSNMDDILKSATKKNIPVIIGTLTSNIKDQPPFSSQRTLNFSPASEIFKEANKELAKNNLLVADSLFRLAKDLDGLRFRAPEDINYVIKVLSQKYNCTLIDIDSAFAALSTSKLTGNNLMIDHLHPTLNGYFYMGKMFFEGLKKYLPEAKPEVSIDPLLDSLIIADFAFSALDSMISEIRIISLKNDWPFVSRRDFSFINKIDRKNIVNDQAFKVAFENYDWTAAHQNLAEYYWRGKDFFNYANEYKVLYSQYPFMLDYADKAAYGFLQSKNYDKALNVLIKRVKTSADDFSLKWIGNIYLMKGMAAEAIEHLEKSLYFADKDPQVYFNLAVAYKKNNQEQEALGAVNKSLELDPNFPQANSLKNDLLRK